MASKGNIKNDGKSRTSAARNSDAGVRPGPAGG